MGLNTTALKELSDNDLDRITGLAVRPDAQTGGILDDVREKILWTQRRGGWNDPAMRETSIADTAGLLVPPKSYHRLSEFTVISSAWLHIDLSKANSPSWEELSAAFGQALLVAYTDAVRNLVTWAEQT